MKLYDRLKKIEWVDYYILGPKNNDWWETLRNPFFGIKQTLGVKNINPISIIDLRIFYIPFVERYFDRGVVAYGWGGAYVR